MRAFSGVNGSISIENKKVIISKSIKKNGAFRHLSIVEIPVSQINKVVYKKASLIKGFIAIMRKGDKIPHSLLVASKMDNAILFNWTKNSRAIEIVNYIESMTTGGRI